MSIENPITRDGPGRRKSPVDDHHKCALHDFIEDRNITCFDVIKGNLKKLEDKMDGHVLNASKEMLNHEKSQDSIFRSYVTKWTLAIVIGVATTAFGVIMGLVSNQISDTHTDIKAIGQNVHEIQSNVVRFRAIQEGVVSNQGRFQRYMDNESDKHPR